LLLAQKEISEIVGYDNTEHDIDGDEAKALITLCGKERL
jgi:hypothetical protein